MPVIPGVTAILMALQALKSGPLDQKLQNLGIVHSEFLPYGQTVNQNYKVILQHLLCLVCDKRQKLQ